ncbi:MAG: hypothetical protein ACP5LE_08070 [Thermoplasmata archaeon]
MNKKGIKMGCNYTSKIIYDGNTENNVPEVDSKELFFELAFSGLIFGLPIAFAVVFLFIYRITEPAAFLALIVAVLIYITFFMCAGRTLKEKITKRGHIKIYEDGMCLPENFGEKHEAHFIRWNEIKQVYTDYKSNKKSPCILLIIAPTASLNVYLQSRTFPSVPPHMHIILSREIPNIKNTIYWISQFKPIHYISENEMKKLIKEQPWKKSIRA